MGLLDDVDDGDHHPTISGSAAVRRTRVSVQTMGGSYELDATVDEILDGMPHLTAARVVAAQSCYHDTKSQMEANIGASDRAPPLSRYGRRMESDRRVVPSE